MSDSLVVVDWANTPVHVVDNVVYLLQKTDVANAKWVILLKPGHNRVLH